MIGVFVRLCCAICGCVCVRVHCVRVHICPVTSVHQVFELKGEVYLSIIEFASLPQKSGHLHQILFYSWQELPVTGW